MNLFAILRHQRSRAARLAAVVFAIGWLGFAVAPCQAMGMESPADAPHHGSMPMDDCGHCPPNAQTPADCVTAAPADCLAAVQPLLDSRQVENPKPAVLMSQLPADLVGPIRARAPGIWPDAMDPPLPHASIQQRYCSFLK